MTEECIALVKDLIESKLTKEEFDDQLLIIHHKCIFLAQKLAEEGVDSYEEKIPNFESFISQIYAGLELNYFSSEEEFKKFVKNQVIKLNINV